MTQPPLAVLPLQYAVGLLMYTLALPFEPLRVEWGRRSCCRCCGWRW